MIGQAVTVVPLHAANPGPMTGSGNWTWLLPGPLPVLIDAGIGRAEHLEALAAQVPSGPAVVLVTHVHPDHAAGAPAIASRWPATRLAKWPWPGRDAAIPVDWEALADGQRIETPAGPLEVVHTPGHSPDHVAFWHPSSRTAFTGDLLVQGSTVVIPASQGGSLGDYLASLARVAALQPWRALPAHGPVIEDPLALIGHYVAHRRQRERQVIEALDGGADTAAAIATRIYVGLTPALRSQAEDSVLAHLLKLADDGVAARHGDHWRRR
jgi:glyoxylase-like metal-dependent hydrolase (beta-lactamase superfamily II)